MKYLVYCVVHDGPGRESLPKGIEGHAVSLVAADGLALAFSELSVVFETPTQTQVLAYARVIDYFHQRGAVLPLRYGCLLEQNDLLLELLRKRHGQFQASLGQVNGCVEMGLRVLLPRADLPCHVSGQAQPSSASEMPGPPSVQGVEKGGRAYLLRRKSFYVDQDSLDQEESGIQAQLCRAFAGLFVQSLAERSPASERLFSIAFLVPRQNVERFRYRFRQLREERPEKVLLTGPWPPYSFAMPRKTAYSHEEPR